MFWFDLLCLNLAYNLSICWSDAWYWQSPRVVHLLAYKTSWEYLFHLAYSTSIWMSSTKSLYWLWWSSNRWGGEGIHIIIFLSLRENICFVYPLEAPNENLLMSTHNIRFRGEILIITEFYSASLNWPDPFIESRTIIVFMFKGSLLFSCAFNFLGEHFMTNTNADTDFGLQCC